MNDHHYLTVDVAEHNTAASGSARLVIKDGDICTYQRHVRPYICKSPGYILLSSTGNKITHLNSLFQQQAEWVPSSPWPWKLEKSLPLSTLARGAPTMKLPASVNTWGIPYQSVTTTIRPPSAQTMRLTHSIASVKLRQRKTQQQIKKQRKYADHGDPRRSII